MLFRSRRRLIGACGHRGRSRINQHRAFGLNLSRVIGTRRTGRHWRWCSRSSLNIRRPALHDLPGSIEQQRRRTGTGASWRHWQPARISHRASDLGCERRHQRLRCGRTRWRVGNRGRLINTCRSGADHDRATTRGRIGRTTVNRRNYRRTAARERPGSAKFCHHLRKRGTSRLRKFSTGTPQLINRR